MTDPWASILKSEGSQESSKKTGWGTKKSTEGSKTSKTGWGTEKTTFQKELEKTTLAVSDLIDQGRYSRAIAELNRLAKNGTYTQAQKVFFMRMISTYKTYTDALAAGDINNAEKIAISNPDVLGKEYKKFENTSFIVIFNRTEYKTDTGSGADTRFSGNFYIQTAGVWKKCDYKDLPDNIKAKLNDAKKHLQGVYAEPYKPFLPQGDDVTTEQVVNGLMAYRFRFMLKAPQVVTPDQMKKSIINSGIQDTPSNTEMLFWTNEMDGSLRTEWQQSMGKPEKQIELPRPETSKITTNVTPLKGGDIPNFIYNMNYSRVWLPSQAAIKNMETQPAKNTYQDYIVGRDIEYLIMLLSGGTSPKPIGVVNIAYVRTKIEAISGDQALKRAFEKLIGIYQFQPGDYEGIGGIITSLTKEKKDLSDELKALKDKVSGQRPMTAADINTLIELFTQNAEKLTQGQMNSISRILDAYNANTSIEPEELKLLYTHLSDTERKAAVALLSELEKAGKAKEKQALEALLKAYENDAMPIEVLSNFMITYGISVKDHPSLKEYSDLFDVIGTLKCINPTGIDAGSKKEALDFLMQKGNLSKKFYIADLEELAATNKGIKAVVDIIKSPKVGQSESMTRIYEVDMAETYGTAKPAPWQLTRIKLAYIKETGLYARYEELSNNISTINMKISSKKAQLNILQGVVNVNYLINIVRGIDTYRFANLNAGNIGQYEKAIKNTIAVLKENNAPWDKIVALEMLLKVKELAASAQTIKGLEGMSTDQILANSAKVAVVMKGIEKDIDGYTNELQTNMSEYTKITNFLIDDSVPRHFFRWFVDNYTQPAGVSAPGSYFNATSTGIVYDGDKSVFDAYSTLRKADDGMKGQLPTWSTKGFMSTDYGSEGQELSSEAMEDIKNVKEAFNFVAANVTMPTNTFGIKETNTMVALEMLKSMTGVFDKSGYYQRVDVQLKILIISLYPDFMERNIILSEAEKKAYIEGRIDFGYISRGELEMFRYTVNEGAVPAEEKEKIVKLIDELLGNESCWKEDKDTKIKTLQMSPVDLGKGNIIYDIVGGTRGKLQQIYNVMSAQKMINVGDVTAKNVDYGWGPEWMRGMRDYTRDVNDYFYLDNYAWLLSGSLIGDVNWGEMDSLAEQGKMAVPEIFGQFVTMQLTMRTIMPISIYAGIPINFVRNVATGNWGAAGANAAMLPPAFFLFQNFAPLWYRRMWKDIEHGDYASALGSFWAVNYMTMQGGEFSIWANTLKMVDPTRYAQFYEGEFVNSAWRSFTGARNPIPPELRAGYINYAIQKAKTSAAMQAATIPVNPWETVLKYFRETPEDSGKIRKYTGKTIGVIEMGMDKPSEAVEMLMRSKLLAPVVGNRNPFNLNRFNPAGETEGDFSKTGGAMYLNSPDVAAALRVENGKFEPIPFGNFEWYRALNTMLEKNGGLEGLQKAVAAAGSDKMLGEVRMVKGTGKPVVEEYTEGMVTRARLIIYTNNAEPGKLELELKGLKLKVSQAPAAPQVNKVGLDVIDSKITTDAEEIVKMQQAEMAAFSSRNVDEFWKQYENAMKGFSAAGAEADAWEVRQWFRLAVKAGNGKELYDRQLEALELFSSKNSENVFINMFTGQGKSIPTLLGAGEEALLNKTTNYILTPDDVLVKQLANDHACVDAIRRAGVDVYYIVGNKGYKIRDNGKTDDMKIPDIYRVTGEKGGVVITAYQNFAGHTSTPEIRKNMTRGVGWLEEVDWATVHRAVTSYNMSMPGGTDSNQIAAWQKSRQDEGMLKKSKSIFESMARDNENNKYIKNGMLTPEGESYVRAQIKGKNYDFTTVTEIVREVITAYQLKRACMIKDFPVLTETEFKARWFKTGWFKNHTVHYGVDLQQQQFNEFKADMGALPEPEKKAFLQMLEDKRFRPEDLVILSNENVPEKDMRYGGYLDAALRMVWDRKLEGLSTTFGETTIKEMMGLLYKVRGSSGTVSEFNDTLKTLYPEMGLKIYEIRSFVPEYSVTDELFKIGRTTVEIDGVNKVISRDELIKLIVETAASDDKYTGVKTRLKLVDETSLDNKDVQAAKKKFLHDLDDAIKASKKPIPAGEARIEMVQKPPLRFFESKEAEYEYWAKEAIETAKAGRLHLITTHDNTEIKAIRARLEAMLPKGTTIHILRYTSDMDNVNDINKVLKQASEYAKKGEGVILLSDRAYRGVDIEVNDKGETILQLKMKDGSVKELPIKGGGARVSYVGGPSDMADLVQALGRVARAKFAGVKEWGLTFDNPVLLKYLDQVLADGNYKFGKKNIKTVEDLKGYFKDKYNKGTRSFEISATEEKEIFNMIMECYERVNSDRTVSILQVLKSGDVKSEAKKPMIDLFNRMDDPLSLARLASTQITDKLFEMGDIKDGSKLTKANVEYLAGRIINITGLGANNIDISKLSGMDAGEAKRALAKALFEGMDTGFMQDYAKRAGIANLIFEATSWAYKTESKMASDGANPETVASNIREVWGSASKRVLEVFFRNYMYSASTKDVLSRMAREKAMSGGQKIINVSPDTVASIGSMPKKAGITDVEIKGTAWFDLNEKACKALADAGIKGIYLGEGTELTRYNVEKIKALIKGEPAGPKALIMTTEGTFIARNDGNKWIISGTDVSAANMEGLVKQIGESQGTIKSTSYYQSIKTRIKRAGNPYTVFGQTGDKVDANLVDAYVNMKTIVAGDKELEKKLDDAWKVLEAKIPKPKGTGAAAARDFDIRDMVLTKIRAKYGKKVAHIIEVSESKKGIMLDEKYFELLDRTLFDVSNAKPADMAKMLGISEKDAKRIISYLNARPVKASAPDRITMTDEEFKLKYNPDAIVHAGEVTYKDGQFAYTPNDPKVKVDIPAVVFGSWTEYVMKMNGFESVNQLEDALRKQQQILLPDNLGTDMLRMSGIDGFAKVLGPQLPKAGAGAAGLGFVFNIGASFLNEAKLSREGGADPYFWNHPGEILGNAWEGAQWAPMYAMGDRMVELGITSMIGARLPAPFTWATRGTYDYKGFAKYNLSYAPFLYASGMAYSSFDSVFRYENYLTSENPYERQMGEEMATKYRSGEGAINLLYESGSVIGGFKGYKFLPRMGISMGSVQIARMFGIDHEKDEKNISAKYKDDIEKWNKDHKEGNVQLTESEKNEIREKKYQLESYHTSYALFIAEYKTAVDQMVTSSAVNVTKWGLGKVGFNVAEEAAKKVIVKEGVKYTVSAGAGKVLAARIVSGANVALWVPFIAGYGSAGYTWVSDQVDGVSSYERDVRTAAFDQYVAEGGFTEGFLWFVGFKTMFSKFTIGDNFGSFADAVIKEQIETEANWGYYGNEFQNVMMLAGGKKIFTKEMIVGKDVPVMASGPDTFANAAPAGITYTMKTQMMVNDGGIAKGRPWEERKDAVWQLFNETFNQVNLSRPETIEKAMPRYLKLLALLGKDGDMKKGLEELMYIMDRIYEKNGDQIVEAFKTSTLSMLDEMSNKGVEDYKKYLKGIATQLKASGLTEKDCMQGDNFAKYYAEYIYGSRVDQVRELMVGGMAPKDRCEAELAVLAENKNRLIADVIGEITRSGSVTAKDFMVYASMTSDKGFVAFAKKDIATIGPAERMKRYEAYLTSKKVKDGLIGSSKAMHKKIYEEYMVKGGNEKGKAEIAMRESKRIFDGHYIELDMSAKSLPQWLERAYSGFGTLMENARLLEKRKLVSLIVSDKVTLSTSLQEDIYGMIDKACENNPALKKSKKVIEINEKGEVIMYYVSKDRIGGIKINEPPKGGSYAAVVIDPKKRGELSIRLIPAEITPNPQKAPASGPVVEADSTFTTQTAYAVTPVEVLHIGPNGIIMGKNK